MIKNSTINETICLTSLANGNFEYYDINCIDDLKEAYNDFDKRIAHDTDIEVQYIDGILNGYSANNFEYAIELVGDLDKDLEEVRDILNHTLNYNDAKAILEEGNYMYIAGNSKLDAFIEYVENLGTFNNVPKWLHGYFNYEKIMRDFEYDGLRIEETEFLTYLFIY